MNNGITLIILKNSFSSAKQINLSRRTIWFLVLLILLALITYGHLLLQYYHMKSVAVQNNALRIKIAKQLNQLQAQHEQVQLVAQNIDSMRNTLDQIDRFEKKIRIIANLDNGEEQNSFFGIGGTSPSDTVSDRSAIDGQDGLIPEIHRHVKELKTTSHQHISQLKAIIKKLKKRRSILAATPAIRPTKGRLTSIFGYRKSPFTGHREFHKGVDLAARAGTPVVATADGVVTYSGRMGSFGNLVVIDHGYGMVTRYGHLSRLLIKKHAHVKRGDVIGKVGTTGRSTGPHLHYEVHLNGVKVNPTQYILN